MALIKQYVIDASVVMKWYLTDEEHADKADSLLRSLHLGDMQLIGPSLLRHEIANGLLMAYRRKYLSWDEVRRGYHDFQELDITQRSDGEVLMTRALEFGRQMNIALYDALYLALADRLGYPLVTADAKFLQRVSATPQNVIWIGDIS